MRILIVEDNSTYGHLVAQRLAQAGFDSDEVTSASAARRLQANMETDPLKSGCRVAAGGLIAG